MRAHAAVEVGRARQIYSANRDRPLEEIIRIHDNLSCPNYKSTYMYSIIRREAPEVVVETGVAAGVSSFSILQALQDNGKGVLHSIDLPNSTEKLPEGESPGFLVPALLRPRWNLLLGDSKDLLPQLLDRLASIDFFCHDSLHTYEHMTFEYQAAWNHIKSGGLLFSDDIESSSVFSDFCNREGAARMVLSRRESGREVGFGWARKP